MASESVQPVRRAARSRLGCTNCKRSHLRCDESSPLCGRCARLRIECKYVRPLRTPNCIVRTGSLRKLLPVPKQTWPLDKEDRLSRTVTPRRDESDDRSLYTGISDGFVQYMHMPRLEQDSPCPPLPGLDSMSLVRSTDYTAMDALDWQLPMGEDLWGVPATSSPPGYSSLSSSLSTFSEGLSAQIEYGKSNPSRDTDTFAAFKSIRQPSAAMLMGGFKKWKQLQTYLLRLSSDEGVVRIALLCLEDVLSLELGMHSPSNDKNAHNEDRFRDAKEQFVAACTKDDLSDECLEKLLAALYLLAWVEVIRLKQPERTEETFPSKQADAIIVEGDCKWNWYSRQLLSCFNSLDAKASHLGGNPILSEKALAVVSRYPIQITDCGYDESHQSASREAVKPNCATETFSNENPEEDTATIASAVMETINTKEIVLRAVLQPVAEWYLRTQVYFRHITCLDKHRRPRFTPEDELEVSLRGRQIQSELQDLWDERPTIVSLTVADLSHTMAPDVAARMQEVFGVYLASYWILFVYLHRVCWWHLGHTDVVRDALSQTWKYFQTSYSSSEEGSNSHLKTVHPALMWPVFIYGSETTCDVQQKWAVAQIKRLGLPRAVVKESEGGSRGSDLLPPLRLSQGVTQNASRAGMLLETLIAEQKSSSGARVDIRDLAVKMFGCFFSIV